MTHNKKYNKKNGNRKTVKAWQPIGYAALFAVAVFSLLMVGFLLYTGVEAIIKGFDDAVAFTFTPPVVFITLVIAFGIFLVLALIRRDQQTYKRGRQSGADQVRANMDKTVKALENKNADLRLENNRLHNQIAVASFMKDDAENEEQQLLSELAGE